MDEREESEEEQAVSRIVVEFAGPGMADVVGSTFENITLGQMFAFAVWAEWRKEAAIFQMERARQKEAQVNARKIVVPGGVVH